jgi:hypothetical protein
MKRDTVFSRTVKASDDGDALIARWHEPMFRDLDSNRPLFYQTYSLVAIWIHFVKVAKQRGLLRPREVPNFDEILRVVGDLEKRINQLCPPKLGGDVW